LADVTARSKKALGKPISRSTVWRIVDKDALKPWRYKYWIFPRDPHFAEKAGLILDLYAGKWQGQGGIGQMKVDTFGKRNLHTFFMPTRV